MTYDDFVNVAIEYATAHPEIRFGQALMNALEWQREGMSKQLIDISKVNVSTDPAIFAWFYEVRQSW